MICGECGEEIEAGRGYEPVGRGTLRFRHFSKMECVTNLRYRAERAEKERDYYKALLRETREGLRGAFNAYPRSQTPSG